MRGLGLAVALGLLGCGGGNGGVDAGPRDSGPRPRDAAADARDTSTACATDAECDDGDECTTDTCEGGRCASEPRDRDDDGHVDAACGGDDCDDTDADRFPGNAEVCDEAGHDEDCDGETFGVLDADGDLRVSDACCNDVTGVGLRCGGDCDDDAPGRHPGATEACDDVDNDCDGATDEGVLVMGYRDADGDMHGDPTMPVSLCAGVAGLSLLDDDCDDSDPMVHGAQLEICDEKDNDCDGTTDEGC